MARASVVTVQRDFSAGQIDAEAKRDDTNPLVKAGVRQGTNGRLLNSKAWQNRSGRRALFLETGRVEEILLAPGATFFLCFGAGTLRVYNATGTNQLFTESGRPWSVTTAKSIVYAIFDKTIVICFSSGVPRVLTWDGATGFSAADYAETVTAGNQKRTVFYRLSPKNVTMLPGAQTGTGVAVTFSSGMNLVAGHVGTYMRFCNRQVKIASVLTSTTGTIDIQEPLPGSQVLTFGTSDTSKVYNVGDVVTGSVSGSVGIVTNVNAGAHTIKIQLLTANSSPFVDPNGTGGGGTVAFTTSDVVVSPSGSLTPSVAAAIGNPDAVAVWDDEVMNSFRGYPQSCFVDQGRLGFCNFASLPQGIGWSWFGLPNDLYVDASVATGAIFELAPEKAQVFHVVPGPDGSEFAFCNNALWRIPISAANPLKPGSVGFEMVSRDGCANVQPRLAFEAIIFIAAGATRVMALEPTYGNTHPQSARNLTELRTGLFNAPVAIAVPNADGTFPERYVYVLNADGTLAVGRLPAADGRYNPQGITGWLPWSGGGAVKWVAAQAADVIFTTSYAPNAIAAVGIVEILDDTYYLDGAQLYNTQPGGLPIPGGKGPLWWIAGGTVDLVDSGARPVNLSTVNSIGNMTANGGLASAFDGAYAKTQANSADKAAADGFVGLNYTARQILGMVLVWPTSDQGFAVGGSGNITLDLRADNSPPVLGSEGTLIQSRSIANQTAGPIAIAPSYNITGYQYAWVRVRQSGATAVCCAQVVPLVGPLWWIGGGQIQVGARMMGTYQVDANGFLVAQGVAGEDFTSPTLTVGQAWNATLEPFIPAVQAGQDVGQRMWPRRLQRFQVYVKNSTGFRFDRLYSGQSGANLPAPGTVMKTRRVATWNVDEDPTQPPPQREQSYLDRPMGRSHDPREAIVKDTPGPLTVTEISTEVTV